MDSEWYKPNTNDGFCMCGCGQKTRRSKYTSKEFGWKKDEYRRFVPGHSIAKRQPAVALQGQLKTCTKCEEAFPLDHFNNDKRGKYGVTSRCAKCERERIAEHKRLNKSQYAGMNKRYRKENEEIIKQKARKYYEENKELVRTVSYEQRIKAYGMNQDELSVMHEIQEGSCAICKRAFSDIANKRRGRQYAIDHCHITGTVRGLLCFGCNSGIGLFQDSVDIIERAMDYLGRAKEQPIKFTKTSMAINTLSGRDKYLYQRYKIIQDDYERLCLIQDHQCGICRTEFMAGSNGLRVDHDHLTNEIRGLLCHKCNMALGFLNDSAVNLVSSLDYLGKFTTTLP